MDMMADIVYRYFIMAFVSFQHLALLPIMKQFYELFWNLFKIKVVLRSPEGDLRVPLGDPPTRIPFCTGLRKHPIGEQLCEECDRSHVRLARAERRPLRYHCHIGMTEFIVPILLDNEIIAFLIAGQIMDAKPTEEAWCRIKNILIDRGLDIRHLKDAYNKISAISPNIQKDIVAQLELFGNYVANAQDQILQVEIPSISNPVVRAQIFIKKNYSEPIHVSEVAGVANTSIRNLSRLFIAETGMTVLDFIHNVRISHAQQLLQSTSRSCLEVALESGFGTVQQFNRVFKKITHTTPKEWRKHRSPVPKNRE